MYIFLQNYKKFRIRESGFIPKTPTELNITQRVAKVVEFNLGVIFDKE